jgi:hypothetical protein
MFRNRVFVNLGRSTRMYVTCGPMVPANSDPSSRKFLPLKVGTVYSLTSASLHIVQWPDPDLDILILAAEGTSRISAAVSLART